MHDFWAAVATIGMSGMSGRGVGELGSFEPSDEVPVGVTASALVNSSPKIARHGERCHCGAKRFSFSR